MCIPYKIGDSTMGYKIFFFRFIYKTSLTYRKRLHKRDTAFKTQRHLKTTVSMLLK